MDTILNLIRKTVVVVNENDIGAADVCFHDLGIKIVRGNCFR